MLLLDALRGNNKTSRHPVWIMRQAGRYLPEYRQLRQKYSFNEMCHQSDLATEVTLMPLKRFAFDAAIVFSDILVILETFDTYFEIHEKVGPVIDKPLTLTSLIKEPSLEYIESQLSYVFKTIKNLQKELEVPLLGFAGAPFTVASYWIEGGSTKTFSQIKRWLFNHPQHLHAVLKALTEATKQYLTLQVKAGVDAVQIFESWASVLTPSDFSAFCMPYLKELVDHMHNLNVPVILFAKGTSAHGLKLASLNPSALSLDWSVDLEEFRRNIPSHIALQGNFDPALLYGSKNFIHRKVKEALLKREKDPSYIVNLGHGMHPDMPLEGVHAFLDAVTL
jgi:uroporphyrinogen decarboxylase